MSVTQYTIPCGYKIPKLKDTVYFVSKSMAKIINIDNGTASVTINNPSPYPMSPSKLQGFNIRLNETESLDERYKFTKQLTMSITGHLTDSQFLMDDDYFLVVEDFEGNFYLINVDFPSKMTYAYTLNEAQNQTDFTFTSNSNHPLLKLNWEIAKWENCKVYNGYGIKNLKLIEKGWAKVDVEQDTITLFDHHTFKDVDFNKASCTLTENYDGSNITNTISFDIPFDNVQSSWQYNLLEFKQNLYIAEILPKNSEHALLVGYENGLQPSYNAVGGTSNGDASKITITLEETSQRGLEELINWSVVENTNKKWVYIKEIDHKNAFTCVGHGLARYDYMAEVDQDGNELGNYKRFVDADASKFPYLNVVGTFDDEVTFQSSVCNCSDENVYKFNEHYYCINGDKVQALESIHTYDCGQSGTINGTGSPLSDYTEIGNVVEESSDFCEDEVEYMWVLKTDVSECMAFISRWVDSGYTCSGASGYDKYLVQKQQRWDDTEGWVDTDPLVTAATLVERNSDFCGYVPTPKLTVNGRVLYCDDSTEITREDFLSLGVLPSDVYYAEVGSCVKSIGDYTFRECYTSTYGTQIRLPEGLESIGVGAFYECYGTSINIPSTVTSIGRVAFSECGKLGDVTIPSGVTTIEKQTFYNCVSLTNLTISEGVKYINDEAFRRNSGLNYLVIPNSVETIGHHAFAVIQDSYSFGTIDIGSGITSIGSNAFECGAIGKVIVRATTPPTLGSNAFKVSYNSFGIFVPCESVDTYKMTPGWSDFGDRIQGIPPCIQPIEGKYKLVLNNGTTVTGGCDSSSAFTNDNVKYYSGSVTTVIIGDCVKSIGNYTFGAFSGLISCTIGRNVETMGEGVFYRCSNIEDIYVPDSVTVMGESIFSGCTKLQSVLFGNGITEIPDETFSKCYALSSVNIPTGVTSIGEYAFSNCNSLVNVDIPNGVISIGQFAFNRCYSLSSATIPDSVTSIGQAAFYRCTGVTTCTIGSGITSIAGSAFYNCSGLTSITCLAETPPTLGNSVFGSTNDCPIYVPCRSLGTYKSAWSAYAGRIQAIQPCNSNKFVLTLNDSSTVSADCDINNTNISSGDVASRYSGSVVSAIVGDCTTTIGDRAFKSCSNLTSITIADSVTSIGFESFIGCNGLTSVTIPNSVTNIGNKAFDGCDNLATVNIGSGVTRIEQAAFETCPSLTSVTIPDSVTYIGVYAFYDCDSLATVNIGSGVTNIDSRAFTSCDSLRSVSVPDSVTNIGNGAFCWNDITTITIGSGVTSIGEWAFESCTALTSVTINATTPPTLGRGAFDDTNNCQIYVPAASVDAYKAATGWSTYASRIQPIPS